MNKSENDNSEKSHRVIASLSRAQIDFLDKIGKDALFSAGVKLSRTTIISAMVNALRRLEISTEGVSSKKELEDTILETVKKNAKIGD